MQRSQGSEIRVLPVLRGACSAVAVVLGVALMVLAAMHRVLLIGIVSSLLGAAAASVLWAIRRAMTQRSYTGREAAGLRE